MTLETLYHGSQLEGLEYFVCDKTNAWKYLEDKDLVADIEKFVQLRDSIEKFVNDYMDSQPEDE